MHSIPSSSILPHFSCLFSSLSIFCSLFFPFTSSYSIDLSQFMSHSPTLCQPLSLAQCFSPSFSHYAFPVLRYLSLSVRKLSSLFFSHSYFIFSFQYFISCFPISRFITFQLITHSLLHVMAWHSTASICSEAHPTQTQKRLTQTHTQIE